MDPISDWISDVIRWIVPCAGFVIVLLAWRRFSVPGNVFAVIGFGLMVVAVAMRALITPRITDFENLSPSSIGQILLIFGLMAAIGMVLVVIALRKMIAGVEAMSADDSLRQDQ